MKLIRFMVPIADDTHRICNRYLKPREVMVTQRQILFFFNVKANLY